MRGTDNRPETGGIKRVAVTGGTGFIGQYLLRRMSGEADWTIRCLSSRTDFSGLCSDDRIEYVHCGTDEDSLLEGISGCSAVIHLGSAVPDPTITQDRMAAECVENIRYTSSLLNACRKQGIANIVAASSISVYDNRRTEPCTEDQRCDPQTIYGVEKLANEKLAGLFCSVYGMKVKSLRISQVFGARRVIKRPLLKMLYENCAARRPLTIFGEGVTAQDYIYVKDVVEAILLALRHEDVSGEFNIGMGRAISANELAEAYNRAFDNPAGIIHDRTKPEKVIHWTIDIKKAKEELGFSPAFSLDEACADMAEIYRSGVVIC